MEQKNNKLGIIMGSNKFNLEILDTYSNQNIITEFGETFAWVGDNSIVLPRHGENRNIPPHNINHLANMMAFNKLEVNKVISFTSVGSLKPELKPTHVLIPDDYINAGIIPTYFDNEIRHIVPGLDHAFRKEIYGQIEQEIENLKFNGVYIQTRGPRLETKAEIQMWKEFGDVVGMTMASEATLAKELSLGYTNISMVDNYCNGILDEPLTMDIIRENQVKNSENVERIIKKILR